MIEEQKYKNILFDLTVCQPNKESKFHGGGVYGYMLFKDLVIKYPRRIIAYYYAKRFVEPAVLQLIQEKNIKRIDADEMNIEDAFNSSMAHKIYSPLYSTKYDQLIKKGVDFIITVHGLRSLEMLTDLDEPNYATSFRDWFKAKIKLSFLGKYIKDKYRKQYRNLFAANNVRIVTVSQHSKYSIKSYFPEVDINRIDVFYSPSTTIEEYEKYIFKNVKEKYFLIISANRWLKNAGRAILAFDRIFDFNPNFCENVKILGLKKNTNVYKRIKHKEKFELLGYQSKVDLEKLYANAYAFVYPTLNEGFGYPPLEAMKYSVPVISSPFSSITEICGDAVLYANPYSIEEIENRILLLCNENFYNEYKNKSLMKYVEIESKQRGDLDKLVKYIIY